MHFGGNSVDRFGIQTVIAVIFEFRDKKIPVDDYL